MKYVIVLGDGMADYPIDSLGGKTPLAVAKKPMMDSLASKGEVGLVKTVPDGFTPGSDVANLGVLGYDVKECYTGRSPLEALSMGIALGDDDIALRTNLVTLSDDEDFDNKKMVDYSAGEIPTDEGATLLKAVAESLGNGEVQFYPGVSYRHLLVLRGIGKDSIKDLKLTPPHNILDKEIAPHLPKGALSGKLTRLIKASNEVLKNHDINQKRTLSGKNSANNIWFWGEGTAPRLDNFEKKYGVKGAMISAVDLLKGIAKGAEMYAPNVEGATGLLNTNYDGKAQTALTLLDEYDFVFVHLEAPDECGHQGDMDGKIKAIELIDEKILTPIFNGLNGKTDFRILVLPDHRTPIAVRTHTSEPVPYFIYDSTKEMTGCSYDELSAELTGNYIETASNLTSKFFA
ncbi:MAG: cofactor-independent phosphoglycerate mutase [Clostridia bacterium]|nr:cofactor-independent phosphoglycerate mutase [Clostridia bacterium]